MSLLKISRNIWNEHFFDRLIICQAIVDNYTLASADGVFSKYNVKMVVRMLVLFQTPFFPHCFIEGGKGLTPFKKNHGICPDCAKEVWGDMDEK